MDGLGQVISIKISELATAKKFHKILTVIGFSVTASILFYDMKRKEETDPKKEKKKEGKITLITNIGLMLSFFLG